MDFQTALLVKLREARWASKEDAADALYDELIERGMTAPKRGSLRTLIYRVETGGTKVPRSPAFPVYLELLGIESQRPSLEALASTTDVRVADLEEKVDSLQLAVDDLVRGIATLTSRLGKIGRDAQ